MRMRPTHARQAPGWSNQQAPCCAPHCAAQQQLTQVWSFGVLLWQLVASEVMPYGKLSVPQILMGVSRGQIRPEWPPHAHPALVKLGKACLSTSPEKRPSFDALVKVRRRRRGDAGARLRVHACVWGCGWKWGVVCVRARAHVPWARLVRRAHMAGRSRDHRCGSDGETSVCSGATAIAT